MTFTLDNTPHPNPTLHSSKDSTMTATLSPTSQTHDTMAAASRVTFGRVVSSEWFKFRTVRSNVVALGSAAAAAIGFGALFSSLAGSGEGPGHMAQSSLSLSLGGFQLSQIIIAILGVALVANEYQTGLIRTWFGAAPDRLRVLAARVWRTRVRRQSRCSWRGLLGRSGTAARRMGGALAG